MLVKGNIVKIKGISQKGKNRVREHGDTWLVVDEPTPCQCFNGKIGHILQSTKDGFWRVVEVENDEHFKILN